MTKQALGINLMVSLAVKAANHFRLDDGIKTRTPIGLSPVGVH